MTKNSISMIDADVKYYYYSFQLSAMPIGNLANVQTFDYIRDFKVTG
ncbi:MAG: hypothetical protein IPO68_15705 [Chitinophagaceae bacterium]|nr:hypothetical protein [Chitinophagaceae bacterium]